ncbi:hypothetical protein DFH06DRAFT_1465551 [Mycena polygramma]|nr:hypothetical protein DFH06DRAFT_1465551 [Mycena polygramma]
MTPAVDAADLSPGISSFGIDQLPIELLVEMFAYCRDSFAPDFYDIDTDTVAFDTEIARLAQSPLLLISRVCSKWHTVALGTPLLWCTIELDAVLWDSPNHSENAMNLLLAALTRGGSLPLNISLTECVVHPLPLLAVQLLAVHSQRWRSFDCPISVIDTFSSVKGQLPRLERLQIDLASSPSSPALDILHPLPNLAYLSFPGPFPASDIPKLPLEQLSVLRYTEIAHLEMDQVLYSLSRLQKAAEFRMELILWAALPEQLRVECPHITADLSVFSIEFLDHFEHDHSQSMLGSIFANLTLPLLYVLELEAQEYPRNPIAWPHSEFLSICRRSSFDMHLRRLEIYDVVLTEVQLLECLSALPVLERLAISDHQPTAGGFGGDQLLITDALLAKLVRIAHGPSLVPRLFSLGFQTVMNFDDHALLSLVVSRLAAPDVNGFRLELDWLPGRERAIDEHVLGQFHGLKIATGRRFEFRMSAAESQWA